MKGEPGASGRVRVRGVTRSCKVGLAAGRIDNDEQVLCLAARKNIEAFFSSEEAEKSRDNLSCRAEFQCTHNLHLSPSTKYSCRGKRLGSLLKNLATESFCFWFEK